MSAIYYSPEKYGLATVGEVDWSDGCYQFDLTVVWRRTADGKLLFGDDSGCSCPSPFEDQGIGDLTECTPGELQEHLEERQAEDYHEDRRAAIADLMLAVTR